MNAPEIDFEFRHHLRDTIILLGGDVKIADLLKKSQDGMITESDVDALRNFNISLIDKTKTGLRSLNSLRIKSERCGG